MGENSILMDPRRVIIESLSPEVDGGRFPAKRVVGEEVVVEADIYADGHDRLEAVLKYRKEGEKSWRQVPMEALVNDRWRGRFSVDQLGFFEFTVEAWLDHFETWREDLRKKVAARQDVSVDLLIGAEWIDRAVSEAKGFLKESLENFSKSLKSTRALKARIDLALDPELHDIMKKFPEKKTATLYDKVLRVEVDREKARFSAWYEMFPRSAGPDPKKHGTFQDCAALLPYISQMGFDVLYFPPVHPIGKTNRKGKNNSPNCRPEEPGSPWAIGGVEGGHKAMHPALGTFEDFKKLIAIAREHGLEMALDLAYQSSPDHPYVKEHPGFFRWRPDQTLQYAENPPKKYEDIYPFYFESTQWKELWEELKSIVEFWIRQGILIFRVDNPHTKPFHFWEYLIRDIKKKYPEVIFLSEAFTRPKVMVQLAKLGFSQSYTYFAWRNNKWELTQYLTELTQGPVREFFRPNFWPNTPDILTEFLQTGGRPAFMIRFILAATLSASYGIYGPAYELLENRPRQSGSEEYLDSEKYEIKKWDLNRSDSLKDLIARVNRIRKENPALQSNQRLIFHPVNNDQLICYSKQSKDGKNTLVVAVNLDPFNVHEGTVDLRLDALGIDAGQPFQVHDLLSDEHYQWTGPANFLKINPHVVPAHIFKVKHKMRTEEDFDYYT